MAVGIYAVEVKVTDARIAHRVVTRARSHRDSIAIEAKSIVSPDNLAGVNHEVGGGTRLGSVSCGGRLRQGKCRIGRQCRCFTGADYAALEGVVVGVIAHAHGPAHGRADGLYREVFKPEVVRPIQVKRMAQISIGCSKT